MKKALIASLFLNLLLAAALGLVIDRFGGLNYVLYRLRTAEAGGSYQHRADLFEKLSEASPKTGGTIFLGDSQVEQCEWRELFGDSVSIKNRGIVGDGANGVFDRLDPVLKERPAKILLWFGVNDLIFGNSVEATAGGYGRVLDKILSEKSPPEVAVLSVMPVNGSVKNLPVSNSDIRLLNEKLAALARAWGLRFIDLTAAVADAEGRLDQKFTLDGLHLNGAGYLEIKKLLSAEINR